MSQRLNALGRCPFCGAVRSPAPPAADDECARCASPLYPAERHRYDYSGQRMLERMPREHRVAITVAWGSDAALAADMRDLSLNGMRLTAPSPLETDQIVRIDSELCRAIARVAYCRAAPEGGFSVGLEFLTLRFLRPTGTFVSTSA